MAESGITESHRFADSVFLAPLLDMEELVSHLLGREPRHMRMGLCVVSNLETHPVQLDDFFPRNIVLLVPEKSEGFGHLKSSAKLLLFQYLGHKGPVRLVTIIKGQDHQTIRNFPERLPSRRNSNEGSHKKSHRDNRHLFHYRLLSIERTDVNHTEALSLGLPG